jgi:mRNA-degrading endonuclease RelE of RelBE toxin-antitoxin system
MEYIDPMKYSVTVKKVVLKRFDRLPENVQERFYTLVRLLETGGPSAGHVFPNYSKLNETEYHCHLNRSYVACWRHEKKTITIEVYYVGSREDAPY